LVCGSTLHNNVATSVESILDESGSHFSNL